MPAALSEDPSLVPNTHFGWLTSACTSSSTGPKFPFLPLQAPHTHISHTHRDKNNKTLGNNSSYMYDFYHLLVVKSNLYTNEIDISVYFHTKNLNHG